MLIMKHSSVRMFEINKIMHLMLEKIYKIIGVGYKLSNDQM